MGNSSLTKPPGPKPPSGKLKTVLQVPSKTQLSSASLRLWGFWRNGGFEFGICLLQDPKTQVSNPNQCKNHQCKGEVPLSQTARGPPVSGFLEPFWNRAIELGHRGLGVRLATILDGPDKSKKTNRRLWSFLGKPGPGRFFVFDSLSRS